MKKKHNTVIIINDNNNEKKHVFAEAAGRGPDGDFFKWEHLRKIRPYFSPERYNHEEKKVDKIS